MKIGDVIFGAVGTAGTFTFAQVNVALGFIAGVLTIFVMALRARKEWHARHDLPRRRRRIYRERQEP